MPLSRKQSVIALALAGLLSGAGGASAQQTDWPTFGGSAQRLGYNGAETTLSQSSVANLVLKWSLRLNGTSLTQPVLISNVPFPAVPQTVLLAVTTHGQVTAVNAATGAIIWQDQLNAFQACRGAWRGINQSPTIDRATLRVFLVDATGLLHALDLRTGAEWPNYPLQVIDAANQAPHTYVHGSPTYVNGQLYLVTSNVCPDTPPYHGQIISVDPDAVAVTERFFPLGSPTGLSGAGIWGPGGIAAGGDGALYAATGNANQFPNNLPLAESILKLDTNLNLVAAHSPIATQGDYDFGATPLLYTTPGCPERLAAIGKTGQLFLYDPASLGAGPLQTIQIGTPSSQPWLIGIPAFDPATSAIYVASTSNSPDGTYQHGLIALAANANCTLSPLWNVPVGIAAVTGTDAPEPVTIANGVVWMSHHDETGAQLLALADTTGTLLWSSQSLFQNKNHPGAPMVANGQVFVGSSNGTLFALGLPGS